jgi:hypothetical protein
MVRAEIVYVLSNPSMHGLLKIGMTDRGDLKTRMKELYTTGVPLPFDCVYACIVEDNAEVEKTMHEKFSKYRVNTRREFFKIDAERVIGALKKYEITDITESARLDVDADLLAEEKAARWEARNEFEQSDPSAKETKDLHLVVGK